MYFVNKKKDTSFRKKNWLKYFVYLILVNILFLSILKNSDYFFYISIAIAALGLFEIVNLMFSRKKHGVGIISILFYLAFSVPFLCFSHSLLSEYLFYTLFITTVFDSFSQLTGQLFGKRKIFKTISPNKTYEGLFGGLFFALITSVLIRDLLEHGVVESLFIGLCLSIFAFIGDLLASYCKRRFDVKDYSNLIPGHGGVLDRFDSLIATGTCMYFINYFIGL
jgi:phosphatidate cytidylyltransferase